MVETPEDELKSLKRQLMKLKLESKLRSVDIEPIKKRFEEM